MVEDDWTLHRPGERFKVSPTTAQRWADRSSRLRTSPRRMPTRTERRNAHTGRLVVRSLSAYDH